MPFTSAQVSQMIGGQQVMFNNQAAFAHNVGAQAGLYPGNIAPLSAPSFGGVGYGGQELAFGTANMSPGGYGSAAVGALGSAIPGIASGAALAGGFGLLGHMGGYLDPITGVGRAFAGGFSRAGGMAAFSAGGGAGVGAIGAGIGAAALPAMGYYAVGKAITHFGEQIYQGAQNISQVSNMANQYFGPSFGQEGSRPGGGMARGQIQQITSVLHEIAGQDTMNSMRDIKQLMDRAGQFGMLTGISNATDFRDRFRRIVGQAKQVAQIMGSTLEEALPTLQSFQSMGMWKPQDVMGGAMALKMVGPQAAGNLMNTMRFGSQMSHAMGGSLAAGAAMGKNQFLNVQAAVQTGILPQEMIQELTGGVGGVEGQEIVAQRMTGAIQSMVQTPMGRLAMAGIGEMKNGRFTGRVDKNLLAKLQKGEITVGELQRRGQENSRTREGAASFTYLQEHLGQEMMSQGGLELMQGMFQAGLEKSGLAGSSDEIQGLMLQKMTGMQRRDAMMVQRILRDLPTLQNQRSRREMQALEDAMRQGDERRNKSWQGLKDVISKGYEETLERPLQELGEGLSTGVNERIDKVTDWLYDRSRQLNMTAQEKMRTMYNMGSRPGSSAFGAARDYVNSMASASMESSFIRRGGEGGLGFFGGVGAGIAAKLGFETGFGTRASDLVSSGARTGWSTGAAGELMVSNIGDKLVIQPEEVRRVTEAVRIRGSMPTSADLFKKGPETDQAMAIVSRAYRSVLADTGNIEKLEELRKGSPADYAKAVAEMVMSSKDPDVRQALRTLEGAGGYKGSLETALNVMSVVSSEEKWQRHEYQPDFADIASTSGANLARLLTSGKEFNENIDARMEDLLAVAGGGMTVSEVQDRFKGIAGSMHLMGTGSKMDVGMTATQLRDLITEGGAAGDELVDFLMSGKNETTGYSELEKRAEGNPALKKFLFAMSKRSKREREFISKNVLEGVRGLKQGKATVDVVATMGSVFGREMEGIDAGGEFGGLRDVLGGYAKAGTTIMSNPELGFNQYQAAEKSAVEYARTIAARQLAKGTGNVINRLRALGGPGAEHIADLAELENLNLTGLTGQQVRSRLGKAGLADEFSDLGQLDPAKHKELSDLLQSGKKLTKAQSDEFINLLKKVEGSQTVAAKSVQDDIQNKLMNSLTNYTDASKEFVIAVAASVPNLKDITAAKFAEAAKNISDVATEGRK